jgi:hypothetical protein
MYEDRTVKPMEIVLSSGAKKEKKGEQGRGIEEVNLRYIVCMC